MDKKEIWWKGVEWVIWLRIRASDGLLQNMVMDSWVLMELLEFMDIWHFLTSGAYYQLLKKDCAP
jgi:hypothetical protein